jgi:hypothetical protein
MAPMANKLNYAPRFRSDAVSVGCRYDKWLQKGMLSPCPMKKLLRHHLSLRFSAPLKTVEFSQIIPGLLDGGMAGTEHPFSNC